MSLRDIAAADRRMVLSDIVGPGEDFVYTEPAGLISTIRGVWKEVPDDIRVTWDVGAEAHVSRAYLTIALQDAPQLTRAAVFERLADGTAWVVEQKDLVAGVGYRLTLAKTTEATVKAAKFRGVR